MVDQPGNARLRGKIAIIEDDPGIRDLIVKLLHREGFDTIACESSAGLLATGAVESLDCLILDLMLPGEDGLVICQSLRAQWPLLPILIVTAKDDPVDRIVGLEIGADDYLIKPFNSRELLARLRSIIRRTRDYAASAKETGGENFLFDGWMMRVGRRDLLDPDGHPVPLTTGEFDLLYIMVMNAQRVLSREFLIDRTRGVLAGPIDRAIDVQIGRLRRKLREDTREPVLIRTIRGDGYMFAPTVTRC